jgi:RHS repeat-associated protein
VVTTAYADTGQPMTLTSSLAGVIGVLRYDAYRRPVTLTYSAGGVAQVWGYYAFNSNGTVAGHGNTEGRLASLKVGTGALNQPHFTYSYDRFGNLETITDAGAPNTFVYDLQNRLTTAYGESYSYDGIGRLTNYEGTALIAFGAYGRRTSSAVYTDDAVGNLTGRLSETGVAQTLKWNHENRLVEVKSSNLLTETYGYDEAGQRVKRTTVAKVGASNVTTTTYYIGAGQEVQNGVPVRYYSLGGNTLGVRQGASVSWLYGDHLGSTSASSGAAATSERYYAYGKDRGTGNLPTDHRFTGQISDASGLVFMNARYYDPVLGSFISPDTLVPEPGQPEGYNKYAYASGNPLSYVDPTGHFAVCFYGGPQNNEGIALDGEMSRMCHDILAQSGYDFNKYGAVALRNDSENIQWALEKILGLDPSEPIILMGHSWGGAAAMTLAYDLKYVPDPGSPNPMGGPSFKSVPVDLMILFDVENDWRTAGFMFGSRNSPDYLTDNVKNTLNIYAKDWHELPFGIDFPMNPQNGMNYLEGAVNVGVSRAEFEEEEPDKMRHSNIISYDGSLNTVTKALSVDFVTLYLFGPGGR